MKIHNIDWFEHYRLVRSLGFDNEILIDNFKKDLPYIELLRRYTPVGSKVLECGCGLARTCISMALSGYYITALDIDTEMLQIAKRNAHIAHVNNMIKFKKIDMLTIKKRFKKDEFDVITHQGVVEHFPINEIRSILTDQLSVAPHIVFSIPTLSKFNSEYFNDDIYRNLWPLDYWTQEVLKSFNIKEYKLVRQRSDNILFVLAR